MASNGGCFQSFEGLLPRLGGGVFDSTIFIQQPSWQPSPMAGWGQNTMQMYYNEPRGYPRGKVEEESSLSAPVALGLISPGVLEDTKLGCCAPRLLTCNRFTTVLVSSSCLTVYSIIWPTHTHIEAHVQPTPYWLGTSPSRQGGLLCPLSQFLLSPRGRRFWFPSQ